MPRHAIVDDADDLLPMQARELLDAVHDEMLDHDGPMDALIARLTAGLETVRLSAPADLWTEWARALPLSHPVTHLLHQDPFTRRCFYKPRGYPGDARMLDYVYGEADDDDSTALGKRLLAATTSAPAPRAVRSRRDALASAIDDTARRVPMPRVLAVACGHLREARCSEAIQDRRIGEFVAFDQDPRSLAVVARDFGHLGVRTTQGHVRDLIVGRRSESLTDFDLIYAAGLYDYLRDEPARRLTETLARMLSPGGVLLVGNFLPDIPDRAYMETFMDWRLIYRTLPQIEALFAAASEDLAALTSFIEPNANIGFVKAVRGLK